MSSCRINESIAWTPSHYLGECRNYETEAETTGPILKRLLLVDDDCQKDEHRFF